MPFGACIRGSTARHSAATRPVCGGVATMNTTLNEYASEEPAGAKTRFSKGMIDMAKFIYLYCGPATPMSDLTLEQGADRMAAFGAWMVKVGAALVDGGSPFGSSASVRDNGSEGQAGNLIGYTIVDADDLTAAKALTDGLPFLSGSDGTFAVEVFQLLSP